MTIDNWLKTASSILKDAQVETSRLDALILIEFCLSKDRSWILSNPEKELTDNQVCLLKKLLKRRTSHEPISYILGKGEFYGREYVLTSDVLEPRPESEAMIELLKITIANGVIGARDSDKIYIADVGTGSGALGITAALEISNSVVDLIDIDIAACKIAKINVDKFTLNISVTASDLLNDTSKYYDVLLCNLPYVPDDYKINRAATHEPKLALFGGPDGLDLYRRLFKQIVNRSSKPLLILTESLPFQHAELEKVARDAGYKHKTSSDFIQLFVIK